MTSEKHDVSHETAPAASLETLHVLLDTSIYGKYVDLNSRLFVRLQEQIADVGIVLHYDPVIEAECRARIADRVTDMVRENKGYAKYVRTWNHAFTSSHSRISEPAAIDVQELTRSAEASFESILIRKFRAKLDKPAVKMEAIMARYWAKKAPFHVEKSKEFPDAIIVEGASITAQTLPGKKMYLVSDDDKMLATAATYPALIPIKSLEAFLQILTSAQNPAIVAEVERYLDQDGFDQQLVDQTHEALVQKYEAGDVYYQGYGQGPVDLVGVDLSYVEESGPYNVIGFDADTITCVTRISIRFEVELEYEVLQPSGSTSTFSRVFETYNRNRAVVVFERPSGDIKSVSLINTVDFADP